MKFIRFCVWVTIISVSFKLLGMLAYLGERISTNQSLDKSDAVVAAFGIFLALIICQLYKTFIKKNNIKSLQNSKDLTLSWSRFFVSAAFISALPILLVYLSISNNRSWLVTIIIFIILISLLSFMAIGWNRLLNANETSPISSVDTGQILEHMIGPALPAFIWFVATIAVIVAVSALFLKAA